MVSAVYQLHGELSAHVVRAALVYSIGLGCCLKPEPGAVLIAFGEFLRFAGHGYLEIVHLQCLVPETFVMGQGAILAPLQPALGGVVGPYSLVGQGGRVGLHLEHGYHEGAQESQDHDEENGLDQGEAGHVSTAVYVFFFHGLWSVLHVHLVQKAYLFALVLQGQLHGEKRVAPG